MKTLELQRYRTGPFPKHSGLEPATNGFQKYIPRPNSTFHCTQRRRQEAQCLRFVKYAHAENNLKSVQCLDFPLPLATGGANRAKKSEGSRWTLEMRRQKNIQKNPLWRLQCPPPPVASDQTQLSSNCCKTGPLALCRPRVLDLCRGEILHAILHWKKVLLG